MGLGPEYADHFALSIIVQELDRFPGKGWALIRASLLSPTVRNRSTAVRSLEKWDRGNWPNEAKATLEAALAAETDEEVRQHILALLSGEASDA